MWIFRRMGTLNKVFFKLEKWVLGVKYKHLALNHRRLAFMKSTPSFWSTVFLPFKFQNNWVESFITLANQCQISLLNLPLHKLFEAQRFWNAIFLKRFYTQQSIDIPWGEQHCVEVTLGRSRSCLHSFYLHCW